MKKTLIAGTVMALLSHGAMAANDWRFAAGADLWNAQGSGQVSSVGADGSYDENYNWSGYLQLEHGILLLPNAKFEMSDFSSSGGSFNNDLLAYDLSLYYRLFNNDLFQIDLGLTGRRYDGDFNTQHYSYDKDVLMAYTGVKYASRGPALRRLAICGCRMPTTTTTVWAAPTSSLPCRSRSAPAGVRPRWTSIASIRPSTAGSSVVNSPSDLPEEHTWATS